MSEETKELSFEQLFTPSKNGEDKTPREKVIETAVQEMFDVDKMRLKSDLKPRQIEGIARASLFAERYSSKAMSQFLAHYLECQVSKDRKGRTEFVSMLKHATEEPESPKQRKLMERLFKIG